MNIDVLGHTIGTGSQTDTTTFYDVQLNDLGRSFLTPDGVTQLDECVKQGVSPNIRIDVRTGTVTIEFPGTPEDTGDDDSGDDPDPEEVTITPDWSVLV